MKKLAVLAVISAMLLTVSVQGAQAGDVKRNMGCGVGTLIFDGISDGFLSQTLAGTTNRIYFTQLSGVSSGTLGCKQAQMASRETFIFVAKNMDNIAKDMAMGEGESISALAELMNVESSKKGMFFAALQLNFDAIYTHDDIDASGVLDNINSIIS